MLPDTRTSYTIVIRVTRHDPRTNALAIELRSVEPLLTEDLILGRARDPDGLCALLRRFLDDLDARPRSGGDGSVTPTRRTGGG